ETLSYDQLNRRANQLAHRLVALGAKPDDRVAICMERSLEMVVGLLAIMKAGAAYVPIDPRAPAERQAWVMRDCGAPVAVVDTAAGLPGEIAARALPIDDGSGTDEPAADPGLPFDEAAVAYVMYTSGSTGTPRGVLVPHRGENRLVVD
ncbi:AMP-binding protein, partial [Paraburkholderia phenazinium]|uniref:AMP-binding protein n=1 Tax=Paraburkholderia phenazinium TaxID=60549 RepID=UPI001591ECA7